MSFKDLYYHSGQRKNLAHFAALTSLAAVNGEVKPEELKLLDRFAQKLHISEEEYKKVMKDPTQYAIEPEADSKERLKRFYDLFRIVHADMVVDEGERNLIRKYAIGMGFKSEEAEVLIERSIAIFGGNIDWDDYLYMIQKEKERN
ncbi:TerB family tellurite resistance protein [Spongiimicrobium sp. 3-5]|uniref:tellurite resistance TerB family protein n=1 Tax=Spongiimicrobium sp. 3-5 TaxID=3332596 RepID=UPI00397F6D88